MAAGRKQYPFDLIEPKWQRHWDAQQTFRAWNPGEVVPADHPFAQRHASVRPEQLPKYYILDMFPYPSGAGLHVGHPEGYTATDILARYRRACGFHVLHPMGWDAFGLPAEQYAVRTGQHPRTTTAANIANFKKQIKSLGFSYDWSRELDTTDPQYFKWTQWIFLKLYNSWFNPQTNKAEPIDTLPYPQELRSAQAASSEPDLEARRRAFRDSRRLAYVADAPVWWCEQLGTVLANEEVEVEGYPVVRKPMRQWMLRITAYAERLLADLDTIEWSDSLKLMQRNWIGRSEGADVDFEIADCHSAIPNGDRRIRVFTTRPDTLFGATYMVLAPEHRLVDLITTPEQRPAVQSYKAEVATKSDLERTESKEKTGVFTGAFAVNPVNARPIPIWIADYVLASYGTGAIMAVPGHDARDLEFAAKFNLPIVQVVQPLDGKDWRGFVEDGIAVHSANADLSLDGLPTPEAKRRITAWLETRRVGQKAINYKLRDWLFSRQRYWGEPFPIVWKTGPDGQPYHEALPESALPILPPPLEDYKPTPDGQPPLARAKDWVQLPDGSRRETNTMPQWAGSCWYYLRYLDTNNAKTFCGEEAERYWMSTSASCKSDKPHAEPSTFNLQPSTFSQTPGVDLYVGGTEHAVLHLLYARFWHKVLYDLGYVSTPEPFFRLVNQGLILGQMEFTKFVGNDGVNVSADEVEIVSDATPMIGRRKPTPANKPTSSTPTSEVFTGISVPETDLVKRGDSFYLKEAPDIRVDARSFKMSKSRGNVVNPDTILTDFGADALRLYEMFLGPLEMVKPWNTQGVEGVYRFLGRVWRLFLDEKSETQFEQNLAAEPARGPEFLERIQLDSAIKDIESTPAQLKTLHACIKKVTEDLDGLRFNTAISALMVFVNEAMTWENKPRAVLRDFLILLQPFAPHLAEELWSKLSAGDMTTQNSSSSERDKTQNLSYQAWPRFDPALLVEDTLQIPVQVNGKLRDVISVPAAASQAELEAAAKASDKAKQFIEGKTVRKIIVVPKKLVNIVVG